MPAEVDVARCDGCKACVEVCPVEAIAVEDVARIDAEACVDCGTCVDQCPKGAIALPG